MNDVLIVGAGIGGLTAALELHRRGIACRVFESAPEIKADEVAGVRSATATRSGPWTVAELGP